MRTRKLLRLVFVASVLLATPLALGYALWTPSTASPPNPPKISAFLPPLKVDLRTLPQTIKILRTRKAFHKNNCFANYRGKCIEKIALEEYIEGVVFAEEEILIHEPEQIVRSLKGRSVEGAAREAWALQALAARTYALYAIASRRHGKAPYDLEDTPNDQAYTDRRDPLIDAAVKRTEGQVLIDPQGRLIPAEYSASCASKGTWTTSEPRQTIACHPRCQDHKFNNSTHSRGMCQWGSFEFARDGAGLRELLERYYPNTRPVLSGPNAPAPSMIDALFQHSIPL